MAVKSPTQNHYDSDESPYRVVILADSSSTLTDLIALLQASNIQVFTTFKPQDIDHLLAEHQPDAIIFDIKSGVDHHLTITTSLRASPNHGEIPIFFASNEASLSAQLEATRYGADAIFSKPLLVELVMASLQTRASRYRANLKLRRDIDHLVKRLNHTAQEALAASRAKAQFIANVSHELRTPLNGILGMSEILAECALPAGGREAADVIRSSSNLLLGLINDVLDFSKIEAGHLEITPKPIALRELVDDLLRLHRHRARQKNLELIASLPQDVEHFCGDSIKIIQIINNLLSNAIKFTKHGQVELRISLQAEKYGKNSLEFQVRDTGIGIAPDDLERVFQPFVQGRTSVSHSLPGTGLGLAISRRLARAMDGDILLSSQVGSGSCFTFHLPLVVQEPTSSLKISQTSASTPPTLTDLDVLVVDDNDINRIVAGRLLKSLGCRPHFAEDGESALMALRNRRFDMILMDCQMPDPNGFAVTRIVRSEPGPNRTTTIVAVTASAFIEDRTLCLEAGMDAYLAKPVTRAALLQTLSEFVKSNREDLDTKKTGSF